MDSPASKSPTPPPSESTNLASAKAIRTVGVGEIISSSWSTTEPSGNPLLAEFASLVFH